MLQKGAGCLTILGRRYEMEKIIDIIQNEVNKFISDWQNSSYEWLTEADIQMEIAYRLRAALKGRNLHISKVEYPETGMIELNKVCCEYTIEYQIESGEREKCRPDIIVFDDIENPYAPPDIDGKNWPMLWVCEIKCKTCWSGLGDKQWDIDKIRYLLKQDDGTKFAYSLSFDSTKEPSGGGKIEEREGDSFIKYQIIRQIK